MEEGIYSYEFFINYNRITSVEPTDMQHRDYPQDSEQPMTHLTSLLHGVQGKELIIADYCRHAVRVEE
jgi:hypothetical protein